MKLLILGGTAFVGRHLAAAALGRGHALTLFNRGQRNPHLFPEAEHRRGDRDGGLACLGDEHWDAVIDTCGYVPRLVSDAAEALRDRVGRYVFISTISVYAQGLHGMEETAPLGGLDDEGIEVVNGETYGPLKVRCEQVVESAFGPRALIIRPGIIAGPHDPTDRFTHWARQMAGNGDVFAPAPADAPLQVIDARDLADWTLRMVEQGVSGVYNATGPTAPLSRRSFLEALRPPGGAARVHWVEGSMWGAEGLDPRAAFPFWTAPEDSGYMAVSAAKAQRAGLVFRPLAETARDTLAWLDSEPARTLKYAMPAATAARLLERLGGSGER